MKLVGRLAFVIGVLLAVGLFAHEGFGSVIALLRAGGAGLVFASLFHLVPMLMNARAWQWLVMPPSRFTFASAAAGTWMRESINGLLPVARIGGEVAAYRTMVHEGVDGDSAAASLVVDLVLSMLSQGLFTLLGIVVVLESGIAGRYALQLGVGFVVLTSLGVVLVVLQRSRLLGIVGALSQRFVSGRWGDALGRSARIEQRVHAIYRQRWRIAASVAWQVGGWILGAGEIWLASYFIGRPASLAAALVLEVVVQTASSIAFLVPGAYGVQEGAYLLIGAGLGFDGPTSLALAACRRVRDLVVFVPGLSVWLWSEIRPSPKRFDAIDA